VLSVDTGSPLVEARVTCAGIATETDTDGRFFLASVPTDNYTAKLEMPNLGRLSLALEVRTGPHVPLVTYHLPMSKRTPRPRISESEGGIVWLGRGSRLRIIDIELNALPDDTHVLVSYIRQDGTARLLNLYRHKVNEEVRTERVYAGPELLPENTQAGDVLHYSGGALTRTDLTLLEIARRRLHSIIGDSALTPRRRIVHRRLGG
jgi:hypothetical protein